MTIQCRTGCGEQITYEGIDFPDGFKYLLPLNSDETIHNCPNLPPDYEMYISSQYDNQLPPDGDDEIPDNYDNERLWLDLEIKFEADKYPPWTVNHDFTIFPEEFLSENYYSWLEQTPTID